MLFAYEDGFKSTKGKLDSALGVALSVGAAVGAAFYKVWIIQQHISILLSYQTFSFSGKSML